MMKDGIIVEQGAENEVFTAPKTPYTKALMSAAFDIEVLEA